MKKKRFSNDLTNMLGIDFPIIVAPMFLVSNSKMLIEASKSGITGCVPALNYRTIDEFKKAIIEIKKKSNGPLGVNLIVNKFNTKMSEQLKICIDNKVDYIITSLGNPSTVINNCKIHGIKVFCDVVDLKYAKKVEKLGADAIIAVNNKAGGHLGPMSPEKLIPLLVEKL